MAAIILGDTQTIDSGSVTPIVLPVDELPIPNVVVLDDVTLINNIGTTTVSGSIIRISELANNTPITANAFYEYNDVIYRAITNHLYTGTFVSSNFIPQGARLESQTFLVTNATTGTLTLSTSPVGKVLNLFVNGIEYLQNVDYTLSGSGNRTITFAENIPWETGYSPTYVEVTIIPSSAVGWGIDDKEETGLTYNSANAFTFDKNRGYIPYTVISNITVSFDTAGGKALRGVDAVFIADGTNTLTIPTSTTIFDLGSDSYSTTTGKIHKFFAYYDGTYIYWRLTLLN